MDDQIPAQPAKRRRRKPAPLMLPFDEAPSGAATPPPDGPAGAEHGQQEPAHDIASVSSGQEAPAPSAPEGEALPPTAPVRRRRRPTARASAELAGTAEPAKPRDEPQEDGAPDSQKDAPAPEPVGQTPPEVDSARPYLVPVSEGADTPPLQASEPAERPSEGQGATAGVEGEGEQADQAAPLGADTAQEAPTALIPESDAVEAAPLEDEPGAAQSLEADAPVAEPIEAEPREAAPLEDEPETPAPSASPVIAESAVDPLSAKHEDEDAPSDPPARDPLSAADMTPTEAPLPSLHDPAASEGEHLPLPGQGVEAPAASPRPAPVREQAPGAGPVAMPPALGAPVPPRPAGAEKARPRPARGPASERASGSAKRLRIGAVEIGAAQAGALALGALAIGALAIGALAIGRLAVGRAQVRRLEVDELVIGTVKEKDKPRRR